MARSSTLARAIRHGGGARTVTMRITLLCAPLLAGLALGAWGCGGDEANGGGPDAPGRTYELPVSAAYPANGCVAAKQVGAAHYCHDVLAAWAHGADAAARDTTVASARRDLERAWSAGGRRCDRV
jgi:hypothetical protein